MAASNIGYATLQVIPSLRGAQAALTSGMSGPASAAGTTAGGVFGGRFAAALRGGAGLAAIAALGVGAVALGQNFQDAYNTIRTETGATGQALEGLEADFRGVLTQTPAGFDDVATAISGVHQRLGLVGRPLQNVSLALIRLSRFTRTDLATNIESVSSLFNRWGITAENQVPRLDQLFRAHQQTGVGVSELSDLMTRFTPVLQQMGFGFDESVGLLAGFDEAGVNTQQTMMAMQVGLRDFAQAGEEPADAFRRFVTGIQDGSVTLNQAFDTFGGRGGIQLFEAIRSGRFEFDALTESIANGSDTLENSAADVSTLAGKWGLLKNRLAVLAEPLAMAALDALNVAMAALLPVVESLTLALSDSGLANGLVRVGAALAVTVVMMALLKKPVVALAHAAALLARPFIALAGWFGTLVAAGGALDGLLLRIAYVVGAAGGGLALLGKAVGVILSPIALLGGTLVFLGTALLSVVAFPVTLALGLWQLVQVLPEVVGALGSFFAGLPGMIVSFVTEGIPQLLALGGHLITAIIDGWLYSVGLFIALGPRLIMELVSGIAQAAPLLWGWFSALPGQIMALLSTIHSWLQNAGFLLLAGFVAGIWVGAQAVWNFLIPLPGRIISFFAGAPTWIRQHGVATLQGFGSGLLAGWGTVWGFIRSIPNRIIGFFINAGQWLWNAGSAIVEGLKNGILNAWDSLVGWLGDRVDSLIGGVMDGLGMGSPSKVFAAIGENIGMSMAMGMERTFPAVLQASDRLTVAALSAPPTPSATAGGVDQSIGQVTFNGIPDAHTAVDELSWHQRTRGRT